MTRRRPPHLSLITSVGSGSRSTLVLDILAKHQRKRLCLSPDRTYVTISTAISPRIWLLVSTCIPSSRRALTSDSWNVSSTYDRSSPGTYEKQWIFPNASRQQRYSLALFRIISTETPAFLSTCGSDGSRLFSSKFFSEDTRSGP